MENYRGILLLCTVYKIYVEIIKKKLENEMEEKGMLPKSQAGFRKRRFTMDNIYILNHIVQKEKKQDKENRKGIRIIYRPKGSI